jgi:hypothetical protein
MTGIAGKKNWGYCLGHWVKTVWNVCKTVASGYDDSFKDTCNLD